MTGRDLAKRRKTLQRRGPASEWSQRAIADRLKLSVDTIVRLENNRNVKLSTYRDVDDEISRGERQLSHAPHEPSGAARTGSATHNAANLDEIRDEIRALAYRIVELARTIDAEPHNPQHAPTVDRMDRRRANR